MQNRRKNLLGLLFTLLFVAYYSCITFFPHVHYTGDVPITHSHPYSNSSHTHSSASIFVISILSDFITFSAFTAIVVIALRKAIALIFEEQSKSIIRKSYKLKPLRAPPVFTV